MRLTTALLCDFAQVRDGLLFVVSGGITRVWRPQVPAPLGLHLALVVELTELDARRQHDLEVVISGEDDGEVARARATFTTKVVEPETGEGIHAPMALDLSNVPLPAYATYGLRMSVDGEPAGTLAVRLAPSPPK